MDNDSTATEAQLERSTPYADAGTASDGAAASSSSFQLEAPAPAAPRQYVTRETVRKARTIKIKDVEVPEWKGWVTLKELTGKERDAFESSLRIKRNGKADVSTLNMRAKLIQKCAVVSPADHSRLFSEDDLNWLGDQASSIMSRLYDEACELSGFSDKDTDDLEEVEGNS